MDFLSLPYLIVFGVAALLFGGWYFLNRRKSKNQKPIEPGKDGVIQYKPVMARIYDRTTMPFRVYDQQLNPAEVKTIIENKQLSRQLVYMGKKVFPFFKMRDTAGNYCYEAIREPIDVKHSPISLHIDMQHPYTAILDDCTIEKGFMQKYGHLLIWLGVIAFLIVMVITSK